MAAARAWIVLGVVLLARCTSGLQLILQPGEHRCVGQELDVEDTATFTISVVGNEHVAEGKQSMVMCSITTPSGGTLMSKKLTYKLETLTNKPQDTGLHNLCFYSSARDVRRVQFNVEVDQTRDFAKEVARDKGHLVDAQLARAEDALRSINKEIDFMSRREQSLKEESERANSRIEWFSMLSIVVLLGTSVVNVVYLHRYLSNKKLL